MKIKKITLIAGLGLALFVTALSTTGCVGTTAQSLGWAGMAIASENLYMVSSQGQLGALTLANGNPLWNIPVEKAASSGGGLGCAAPSTIVAVYGSPAIAGDLIYVAGYNGKVYTYSATTRLSSDTYLNEDAPEPIVGGPIVGPGRVYVASADGKLYALDATSLAKIWEFKTGDKIWSTPALDGNTLYVGSFDKKLYAIDATSGQEKWSFTTQGAIVATPVVYNGIVYVASLDRHIYALDKASGELKWQFPAGDSDSTKPQKWFWTNPAVSGGILYAPSLDGKVYALKSDDGTLVTTFDLKAGISSSPAVVNGNAIVATEDGKLYSLNATTNRKIELRDLRLTVRSPLLALNGVVYVHTQKDEALYAINAETGAVVWYTPIAS